MFIALANWIKRKQNEVKEGDECLPDRKHTLTLRRLVAKREKRDFFVLFSLCIALETQFSGH